MKEAALRSTPLLCSILLVFGAVAHARAFPGASAALGRANLPPRLVDDFRTLWLFDSATLLIVGALMAILALRAVAASRLVGVGIAAIPAATGVLIYAFVGNFYAGHLLVATAVAAAASVLRR